MKLAFVAPRSWPAVGGMENFLRDLTRELALRHEVLVLAQGLDSGPRGRLADSLAPPPAFAAFSDGDVRVEPLRLSAARRAALTPLVTQIVPGLRRYAYGRARRAATELFARTAAPVIEEAARGADVVHMWGGDLLGAAAVRAAHSLHVPVVMTPFAHEGRWGDDPAAAATYRTADAVVALLETEAELYAHHGVADERIHVCGVCTAGAREPRVADVRREHGIEGPLVLFLGVRREYKGFDLLLEAAPLVAEARPNVTFAFVGPGRRVPAPSRVRIVDAGEVDAEEKAAWLDAADLLCLPSASEILPTSFLEAWSVGTPVLSSDIPPLEELVRKSGGGWTSPLDAAALAAAIVEALRDPDVLMTRGAAGERYWREHCTPEAVAAKYEQVYASAAGAVAEAA